MSIRDFVTRLFGDTDVEHAAADVRTIGQQHADTLFDSYRDGFFDRLSERMDNTAEEFHAGGMLLDVTDYSAWEYKELLSEAKRLGYDGTKKRDDVESWLQTR